LTGPVTDPRHPEKGSLVVADIGWLVSNHPDVGEGRFGTLRDAAVVIDAGLIVWVGASADAPPADRHLDAGNRCVIPGFVDSHTHLVFAGDRSDEFAARMAGERYGSDGIARTVAATRAATGEQLADLAGRLAAEALRQGTTTLETKSGYGLSIDDEPRCLEVAGRVAEEVSFLGAHIVPPEFRGREHDYVDLVAGAMMDRCAPMAQWCDAFCETGAFDEDAARVVLESALAHGLGLRVHANQLGLGPGVRLACELGAASADHCTYLDSADVDALAASGTVATLLPGAEFSTRSPYPDARRLLDAAVTVALATDCNPGSSYTTSMPFVIALAVREMAMTPDEALWAATAGGATALRRDDVGAIAPGMRGDLVILDAPNGTYLPYRPGVDLVAAVVRAGVVVAEGRRGPARSSDSG
jgi:imidazolonepropionase